MQAVVFSAPHTLSVEQVADPVCGPDEVIVQVSRCGICGTDVHIYRNEYLSEFPLIPGHEFGGVVVETGRDVTDLRVGDRVAVDPNLYCGRCDNCRNEMGNHCANWQGVGVTRSGGFADYCAAPARACYHVPAALSDAQMAFIEPLACVAHAMKRFRVTPGDDLLLFGAGPMGQLLVQVLRHSGAARVVVVDKQPERLALATRFGAAATVVAGPDQKAALAELAPHGFGAVVDATGVPAVIEQALGYLRPRGSYLQFGVAPKDATVRINPYEIFKNDWSIIGSFALCYTFQPAIAWLAGGVVDVEPLVSHTLPMNRFAEGFEAFAQGKTLKVQMVNG